jgi:hypothetical protein
VLWLEVHPASSPRHVDDVLGKLAWLRNWLSADAPDLDRLPRHFRWAVRGPVRFRRGSREQKLIAAQGLRMPTRQVDLDELE